MAELKLVIGADVKEANKAIDSVVSKAERAGDELASAFKPLPVNLPASINKTNQALSQVPRSSNDATLALTNLGRVAQDAPFGFLGIANNLNPLLESFQRLKVSSGTTGGALKALGRSMLGAGGLGFALSIVSSLLITFGDDLFGLGKKSKEADEAFQALANNVATQAVKLTTLVGIIRNANSSYDDKTKALKAINQEYDDYLKNLGIEEVNVNNLTAAYDRIVDSMLRQAVVKGLQDEITKKVEETAKQIIGIETAEKKRLAASQATADAINNQETAAQKAARALQGFNAANRDGINAQLDNQAAIRSTIESTNDYESVLKRAKDQLTKELAPLLDLTTQFEDLGIKLDSLKTKNSRDELEKFIAQAKQLAEELRKIGFIQPTFSFFDTFEEQLEKARKVVNDFNQKIFRLDPKFFKIEPAFSQPKPEAINKFITSVQDGVNRGIIQQGGISIDADLSVNVVTNFSQNAQVIREFTKIFRDIGQMMPEINLEDAAGLNENILVDKLREFFGVGFEVTKEELAKLAEEFRKGIDNINNIFKSVSVEGLNTFAEALGVALAGGDVRDVFQGFISIVADGLTAIGKQMIALSPIISALKAALKTLDPKVLLPAGLALVAIGAALRSSINKGITGFAQGGLVFGPTLGLVGEGIGTSRSNPEVIAPLDKLRGMLSDLSGGGFGSLRVEVVGRMRGKDQILQNYRTSKSQRRLGSG